MQGGTALLREPLLGNQIIGFLTRFFLRSKGEKYMALTIEGGPNWLYYNGLQWEPIPTMPEEYLRSDGYLSAEKSTDAVTIHPKEDGAFVSVYRSPSMPGRLKHIKVVELVGAVQRSLIMSYELGPGAAALHLSYGSVERLIITVNGV